jgi:hypothetical protein
MCRLLAFAALRFHSTSAAAPAAAATPGAAYELDSSDRATLRRSLLVNHYLRWQSFFIIFHYFSWLQV